MNLKNKGLKAYQKQAQMFTSPISRSDIEQPKPNEEFTIKDLSYNPVLTPLTEVLKHEPKYKYNYEKMFWLILMRVGSLILVAFIIIKFLFSFA